MKTACRILRYPWAFLAMVATLTGCQANWEVSLQSPETTPVVLDRQALSELETYAEIVDGIQIVPVDRVLGMYGFPAVERVTAVDDSGGRLSWAWPEVAEWAYWRWDGQLQVAGEVVPVSQLEVEPPEGWQEVEAHITDIAPTVAAALGIRPPSDSTGRPLVDSQSDRVCLIFLDGFGFLRWKEAQAAGLVPNLDRLTEPKLSLTVYPPITTVASAATLTGAPPEMNGVDRRGIRKTEAETILDIAAAAGLKVMAVEGEALAFELRGAEFTLSGDRDGNGSTDDNVLANALAALAQDPDLLWVHFHGIDDAGHEYGPGGPEEEAVIQEVDAAVGELMVTLPPGTLTLIFADHGMHLTGGEERAGNHGQRIARDMYIPIFLVQE